MSIERDWSHDGGMFLADDGDGWRLEEQLDVIERDLRKNHPDYPTDIVPERLSLIKCIAMVGFIGMATTTVTGIFIEAGSTFVEAWKAIH
jgi:hypothetical protein